MLRFAMPWVAVVIVLLSGQAYPVLAQRPKDPEPTHANVAYGPHRRNVLDLWIAPGRGPRPLLVYIHGGGWVVGDKRGAKRMVRPFLQRGVSVAAINYRLTGEHPLPAPVHDAARAIQFLRWKAAAWNIDPKRIAVTGGSAGGCTSLWLALHDDLADPQAKDPVLRQSTRVVAAAVRGAQTAIDPPLVKSWVGPAILQHRMIWMAVGEPDMASAWKNYEKHRPLYREFSPYYHLTKDDPPLFLSYNRDASLPSRDAGHGIHHPVLGVKLKEKADALGVECHLVVPKLARCKHYRSATEFLLDKLLGSETR